MVDASTGTPIPQVSIDLWTPDGRSLHSALTNEQGEARARIPGQSLHYSPPLSAVLSTDNYTGLVDQVHEGIQCPPGSSVFRGGCTLQGATELSLPHLDPATPAIVFRLGNSPLIFEAGFE